MNILQELFSISEENFQVLEGVVLKVNRMPKRWSSTFSDKSPLFALKYPELIRLEKVGYTQGYGYNTRGFVENIQTPIGLCDRGYGWSVNELLKVSTLPSKEELELFEKRKKQ